MENILANVQGFEWDEGNISKSQAKHGVGPLEAEEAFFNFLLLSPDPDHSLNEPRYRLLGSTNSDRILFIVFTVRKEKIRIISSRVANKYERLIYAKAIKESS